ncbi:phosducin, putative [Talaromyces marneffei ATCC 18224]|uniref:Phosducin, putative n=1 Tax=Talaromyces marneffei (strain ATCC 18224 / CBS 334.59 / QM 7333) TaxID=441960 RepID=B6Q9R1_TALMQ|nr:phosducin, putative [Talaromyces marneffei ATCC 18224]
MSSAQDEFDRLIRANRDSSRTHPEDRDQSGSDSPANNNDASADDQYELSDADSDYGDHIKREDGNMVSRTGAYTVPSTVFEANTGPKGVIADAQSFERARKKSFRRTLLSAARLDSHSKFFGGNSSNNNITQHSQASSSPPSDEEDEFMRRWRESRLQELQERGQRRPSPSKRIYGRVDTVDAEGYLNAIERVASDTVVVVCIYDPESSVSAQVEDAIEVVARKYITTHFIKLHHEIAEMSHIEAPALLAYKGGDIISTLIDIPRQIPRGGEISSLTIEDLLKRYVLSFNSYMT